jgi:4-hydroxybenzoate polyprenyltransferase
VSVRRAAPESATGRDTVETAPVAAAPLRGVAAYVAAARPLQWTKNLLLFAGLVFAEEYGELASWVDALTIFAAYCAASSAAYLVNDVVDVERDRAHPTKASRPIAAGTISPRAALVTAGILLAVAFPLALATGFPSMGLLAGFVALQAAYSIVLKQVVILDVMTISGLFVIRAAAGALAIDVQLSPWLVLCTGVLALFLALAKRRAELAVSAPASWTRRPVLGSYSLPLLDQLIAVVTASTISAYSLYTFTATESSAMMLTIPFVVFALFRYLQLVHAPIQQGEEPEKTLTTDRPLLLTIASWAAAAILILALE